MLIYYFEIFTCLYLSYSVQFLDHSEMLENPFFHSIRFAIFSRHGYSDYICIHYVCRKLDSHLPIFLTEECIVLCILGVPSPFNTTSSVCLLAHLAVDHKRLEIGELLLPKLVDFYNWIITYLSDQLDYSTVCTHTIDEVMEYVPRCYRNHQQFCRLYKEIRSTFVRVC